MNLIPVAACLVLAALPAAASAQSHDHAAHQAQAAVSAQEKKPAEGHPMDCPMNGQAKDATGKAMRHDAMPHDAMGQMGADHHCSMMQQQKMMKQPNGQ